MDDEGIKVFQRFSFEDSLNLVVIGEGICLFDSEHSLFIEYVDCLRPQEIGRVELSAHTYST